MRLLKQWRHRRLHGIKISWIKISWINISWINISGINIKCNQNITLVSPMGRPGDAVTVYFKRFSTGNWWAKFVVLRCTRLKQEFQSFGVWTSENNAQFLPTTCWLATIALHNREGSDRCVWWLVAKNSASHWLHLSKSSPRQAFRTLEKSFANLRFASSILTFRKKCLCT